MKFELPNVDLIRMLPEIFLFLWTLVVITFDLLTKRRSGVAVATLTLAGLAITGAIMVTLSCCGSDGWTYYGYGFGEMFKNDPGSIFFKVIFLCAAFLSVGMSYGIIKTKIVHHRGEYFGMILFSTLGMMFVASSNELISLYIGLELTTIPLFVLAAFYKDNKLSVEAGIKYLIVGAFSSALLLYGMSLLYGFTAVPAVPEFASMSDAIPATTELTQTANQLANKGIRITRAVRDFGYDWSFGLMVLVSTVCMLAGIGFKLALPPFHQWAPDVYEGSPTPIAAFLSVGSKAAGLIVFAKIFVNALGGFADTVMQPNDWGILVGVLASLAMIIGNVGAIRQSNIKRMLAYSSIAQAGYIMIGMLAMNSLGMASVAFYIFVYMFANMGIFAIATMFEDKTGSVSISSYRGLSRTSPFMAGSMSIFLLSLAGIPPLGGFLAKYYVFAAAIDKAGSSMGNEWLYYVVGVGLITSVFALYYYANIIRMMYFAADQSPYRLGLSNAGVMVVIIGLVGVFYCGLFPGDLMEFVSQIPATLGINSAGR